MKKSLLLITLGIIALLCFSGCQPMEVDAYCLTSFDQLKEEHPDLPETYIGFCVSSLQSGSFRDFNEVCESTSIWNLIKSGWFGTQEEVSSCEDCICYFETVKLLSVNQ